jgi:hypothetical protein
MPVSTLVPAYQDMQLEDRPGEHWKDIPNLKGYYQISNFGRVKRMARTVIDANGNTYVLPCSIRKAVVNKDRNIHAKDWTYRLQILLQFQNKKYSFQISRLVYYCFVQKFLLKDSSLVVTTRNQQGLDIWPENLLLLTQAEKCKRPYLSGRQRSPLSSNRMKLLEAIEASRKVTNIMVSQYHTDGRYIATFESITEAAHKTGICYASIAYAARLPARKAGGYYWRKGDANKVNLKQVSDILKQRQIIYKMKKGVGVAQLDMGGAILLKFYTISDAAKKTGISHKTISNALRNPEKTVGGYRWVRTVH